MSKTIWKKIPIEIMKKMILEKCVLKRRKEDKVYASLNNPFAKA